MSGTTTILLALPLNERNFTAANTNWWFRCLDNGNYITSSTTSNNLWRCTAVQDADIQTITISSGGTISPEGYGPLEDTSTPANGVIRYYLNPGGFVQGARKMNTIKRTSQIWLVGDVGRPKSGGTVNQLPTGGYYTDITAIKPVVTPAPGSGWTTVPSNKQAACRHNARANFVLCDGHVETWKWADLSTDVNDVFAVNSF